MRFRHSILPAALAVLTLSSPAQAEFSAEHLQLVRQLATAAQNCADAGFIGLACYRADQLNEQAAATGIFWRAAHAPYYCDENRAAATDVGFPYSAAAMPRSSPFSR